MFIGSSQHFVLGDIGSVGAATKLQALCEQNLGQSLGFAGQVTSALLKQPGLDPRDSASIWVKYDISLS